MYAKRNLKYQEDFSVKGSRRRRLAFYANLLQIQKSEGDNTFCFLQIPDDYTNVH